MASVRSARRGGPMWPPVNLPPGGRLPLSRGRFPLSGGNGRRPKGVGMMSQSDRGDRDRSPPKGADEGDDDRTFPAGIVRAVRRPHWGPEFAKSAFAGVSLLRLSFLSQRARSVFRRRGAQCAPAGRSGTGPYERPESPPSFRRGGTPGRPMPHPANRPFKPRPCQDGSTPL